MPRRELEGRNATVEENRWRRHTRNKYIAHGIFKPPEECKTMEGDKESIEVQ